MPMGPFPTNTEDYKKFREELLGGYKRTTKKQLERARLASSMSRGWYDRESDTWGPKPKQAPERRIRSASGRYSYVPDDAYGDSLAFQKRMSNAEVEQYIESANFRYDTYVKHPGPVGHIARMEYSPGRTMMKVTFTNGGDVCIYFRVPTSVFGTLYWLFLEESTQISAVDGTERHAVGIQFWDLVRIRGTKHSGHYSFVYGSGEGQGEGEALQEERHETNVNEQH